MYLLFVKIKIPCFCDLKIYNTIVAYLRERKISPIKLETSKNNF